MQICIVLGLKESFSLEILEIEGLLFTIIHTKLCFYLSLAIQNITIEVKQMKMHSIMKDSNVQKALQISIALGLNGNFSLEIL